MSQRVKKPTRAEEAQGKRRRRRPSGSEDVDEDGTRSGSNSGGGGNGSLCGMWTPRHLGDLKVSSIYNRNSAEAPAELYRKDLISAMKLADSEPLTPEEYWLITDPWKQEWEKGVQVPVNPESLPQPEVVVIKPVAERGHDFRLPKKKYVRVSHDDFFNPDYHQLVSTAARAEKVCSYDLDDVDSSWLSCANADRSMQSLPVVSEFLMEQVVEELELQCWEQVQTIIKSQEGLGIEYDENVICDVCRSPECEEGNEMVFCDSCNICVHQACYGIITIPSGPWMCRTCTLGIKPPCVLCPNTAGAMKATRSGHKWAHVACAIWIPEVSIGSVERMEPITKISAIPQSRWSLLCVLCKDKTGACIQCSVKTCKTAYHVTCAFKNGLEMKPIIVDENAEDGIKLRSYCQKHSVSTKKEKAHSGSEEEAEKKRQRSMTAEEKNQARAEKLQQIESEFFKYVRLKDVSQNLAVDMDIVNLIYNYWKQKRKSRNNRPLVPPRPETTQLLTQQQEQDLEQMKMFVQLRQDLERVRNLCYMVSRREKLSRTYLRLREQTFQKQVAIVNAKSLNFDNLREAEKEAVLEANHGPSIYDQMYSHDGVTNEHKSYDLLVSLIGGEESKINGMLKPTKARKKFENPYKKTFVNGTRRRTVLGESCSSLSESEASLVAPNTTGEMVVKSRKKATTASQLKSSSYLFESDSSRDAIIMSNVTSVSKKLPKKKGTKAGGLKQMEQALQQSSASDSDELHVPDLKAQRGTTSKRDKAPIYSDTDSDSASRRITNIINSVATKGALKEFSGKKLKEKPTKKLPMKKTKCLGSGRKKKKDDFDHSELIVPQREAAKKASESIRTVKGGKVKEGVPEVGSSGTGFKDKEMTVLKETTSKPKQGQSRETISDSESTIRKKDKQKLCRKTKQDEQASPCSSRSREIKDEFDFEENLESNTSVSYVPQRQAAKKAAEHIRSGLSNIVAARLIIEDEMEASRKKNKSEKSTKHSKGGLGDTEDEKFASRLRRKSGSPRHLDISNEELQDVPSKVTKLKELKGDTAKSVGKSGRREVGKSPGKEGTTKSKDTDWPFLDKGSQSACRRNSRGRSSSSSCSSSSSSSGSSSSSHSSSSSRSSSPASASPVPSPTRKPVSTLSQSPSIYSTTPGRGRKLKTSERGPSNRNRTETAQRTKPTPKSRRPTKSGSGRSAVATPSHEFSPEPLIKTTIKRSISASPSKLQQETTSRAASTTHKSPSPSRFNGVTMSPQKKSPRGNREPKLIENEKETQYKNLSSSTNQQQKAPSSKALGLQLSSDSESEPAKASSPTKTKCQRNDDTTKTKKKTPGDLSESDYSAADEKENSHSDVSKKVQSQNIPASASVLSPLIPSSDNRDQEQHVEPHVKRPRLESSSDTVQQPQLMQQAPVTNSNVVPTSSVSAKSIFSPTSKEAELIDFDNDLYDLARSVTEEYHQGCENAEGTANNSLSFSFPQDFLCREDNKEDSARATLNLVEKLRLQHLRKSGAPSRTSTESEFAEDEVHSPTKSKEITSGVVSEVPEKVPIEPSLKAQAVPSPEKCKSIQGDERWVPPSETNAEAYIQNNNFQTKAGLVSEAPTNKHVNKIEENLETYNAAVLPNFQQVIRDSDRKEDNNVLAPDNNVRKMQLPVTSSQSLSGQFDESRPSTNTAVDVNSTQNTLGVNLPFNPAGFQLAPFMYPIPPSLANVVTSLSSGNPLSFFHSHSNHMSFPKVSPNLVTTSSPLGTPPLSYPPSFPPHFISPVQQLPPQKTENTQPTTSAVSTESSRIRHGSDLKSENNLPNSLASVVTSGMPPLAKPPLTSPSVLLAANTVNKAMAAPPQSTVAQIIESVIQASNNHSHSPVSCSQPSKGSGSSTVNTTSNSDCRQTVQQTSVSTSGHLNRIGNSISSMNQILNSIHSISPNDSPVPQSKINAIDAVVSDFTAILANKNTENIILPKTSQFRENLQVNTQNAAVSPKGGATPSRSKKATTPRKKTEEASPKGAKAKRERKLSGTSPGRGTAKGKRGAGRGKLKGKNFMVRKDLAGTVYDIDFDEFEENTDGKLDFKMLRERRKSNEVHSESRKSESSNTSPSHMDKASPKHRSSFDCDTSVLSKHDKQYPLLHAPLPGPVDMRTYSLGEINSSEHFGKVVFPHGKDPNSNEITSLFMGPGSHGQVNDLDELDKTLEALTAASNTNIPSGNSISAICTGTTPKILNIRTGEPGSKLDNAIRDSATEEGKDCRNQLKFKIKGPFLDSSYGTQNIQASAGSSTFQPPYHTHANQVSLPIMMNVPPMMNNTSNLRRMRKKELLRQYWTQDMNMDPPYGTDMGHYNPMNPLNRSVITIPKAVASMAILPSKDDYRFDNLSESESNGNGSFNMPPNPAPPPEKKRRSRGGVREMVALGLMTPESAKEKKDKNSSSNGNSLQSELEYNSRKRPRIATKPNRSTFIPPTLVEAEQNSTLTSLPTSLASSSIQKTDSQSVTATSVITAVNYPTPKLKIKFADLTTNATKVTATNANQAVNTNHLSDSDDIPSKRAKGRPPKKRGIAETASSAPTMEELKRQSMKYRELIFKEFEGSKKHEATGKKKSKKKSHKARKAPSDEPAAEVKLITADPSAPFPKLILRFNKKSKEDKNGSTKSTINGPNSLPKETSEEGTSSTLISCDKSSAALFVENDSGFTGSSEGSSSSVGNTSESKANNSISRSKKVVKDTSSGSSVPNCDVESKTNFEYSTTGNESTRNDTSKENTDSGDPKSTGIGFAANESESYKTPAVKATPSLLSTHDITKEAQVKLHPIRLKLSRCYEGSYSLKSKNEADRDNTNPQQSDSCEVR